MTSPDETPLVCHRCGALLEPGTGTHYVVRIEAFADPTPPDLSKSPPNEPSMESLLDAMKEHSEQELLDQVYRRLTLLLCTPCFTDWIERPTG